MSEFLTNTEINQFKKDGAIFVKGKFGLDWIEKLHKGIERDIKNKISHRAIAFKKFMKFLS